MFFPCLISVSLSLYILNLNLGTAFPWRSVSALAAINFSTKRLQFPVKEHTIAMTCRLVRRQDTLLFSSVKQPSLHR